MSASTKIHGEPRPPAARGHGQLDGGGVRALDKKSPAATPASKGGNAGEPGKVLAFAGDQWHADVKKRLAELETKGKLKEADLDQGALKALKTLPYEVALACLEKIANERNAIRNINAFVVTNCTHLRNQWGLAPPAAPARDAQDDRVRLSRSSHAEESPGGGAPPAKKKKKAVWANMQLNKQILACEDAGELCALIQARVAEFDHVNVATAFRRLLQTRRQGVSRAVADQALWQLEASALLTMDDFQPQEISSTLHALAKARHAPSDPLLLDALERQAEAVAGTFNAQQVANTLWAYAKLGRAPGAGVMRGLEGRAEAVAGGFKAQDVANTLWAVCVFSTLCAAEDASPWVRALAPRLVSLGQADIFNTAHLRQLHQFFVFCSVEEKRCVIALDDVRSLRDSCRLAFVCSKTAPSAVQQEVSETLRRMGLSVQDEARCPKSGYSIDMLVHHSAPAVRGERSSGRGGWAVEFDGPSHSWRAGRHRVPPC